MLKKPIVLIILVASVLVAAFVGGFVAEQFKTHVAAVTPNGTAQPVDSGAPATGAPGGSAELAPQGGRNPRGNSGSARPPSPPPAVAIPQPQPAPAPPPQGTPPSGQVPPVQAPGTPPAGDPIPPSSTVSPPATPRAWHEVVVPAGQTLTIRLTRALSSETSRVEDLVDATIADDVLVNNALAIRKGTPVRGTVTEAQKGSSPSIGVRFHTLVPRPGLEVDMRIDPVIQRIEASRGGGWTKIILGAATGAAVGGLTGGAQGVVKGGAAGGAGGAAAATITQKPKVSEVVAGSTVPVLLLAPITVMIER